MSMRMSAVEDYGLLFGEEEMNYAKKYLQECRDDDDTTPICDYDVEEWFGLSSYGEFEGEAILLDENGFDDYSNFITLNDDCSYLPLNFTPQMFSVAYPSMDSVVEELKGKLNGVFPEDYDYTKHVFHIIGTYYG